MSSSSYNKFEFNWYSHLGAVSQTLSKYSTSRYPKNHTHKISAQSFQWFWSYSSQNMSCLLLFRRSCPEKKLHGKHNIYYIHNLKKAAWKFEQNLFRHWWDIKKVRYKILLPQKLNQKYVTKNVTENLTKNSFRVKI